MVPSQPEQTDRFLTCGVELELELSPIPNLEKKYEPLFRHFGETQRLAILAAMIDERFQTRGFNSRCLKEGSTIQVGSDSEGQYKHWIIANEFAAAAPRDPQNWVVELVSRVLMPNVSSQNEKAPVWSEEIRVVWDVIDKNFTVVRNPGCGTHVHVRQTLRTSTTSANSEDYYLPDLQAVIKGIVYWEEAIASCIPEYRRYNDYAVSNTKPHAGPKSRTQAMRDYGKLGLNLDQNKFGTLFDKIDGLEKVDSLTGYIGGQGNLRHKHMAWNFAHFGDSKIKKNPLNTIEFRRSFNALSRHVILPSQGEVYANWGLNFSPPMAASREETLHWITLAAAFVTAAPKFNFSSVAAEAVAPSSWSGLKDGFLNLGLGEIIDGETFLQIEKFAALSLSHDAGSSRDNTTASGSGLDVTSS